MGKKNNNKNHSFDTQSEVSSVGGSVSTFRTNHSDDDENFLDVDMVFKEMVEDISHKNSKKSIPGLKFVKTHMQKNYMITLLTDYKETLSTELYKALRKSKGEFQIDLYKTMSILFLSISPDDSSNIFSDVQRELLAAIMRSKKGSALCLAIASSVQFSPEEVLKTTEAFRSIIKIAVPRDRKIPILKPGANEFIIECVDAWKFVIAVCSRTPGFGSFIRNEIDLIIDFIGGLLLQHDVEMRIATGEALSIIYELSRCYYGEEWEGFDNDDEIIDALEDLASGVSVGGGSVKEAAKKERKAQRSSFRNILDYIRDYNDPPITNLQLTRQERIELNNFCNLNIYETIRWCLESGVTNHLTFNELLRSNAWFELGNVLPPMTSLDKSNAHLSKLEKQVQRSCADKSRSAKIKKNRLNACDDHYYE